MVYSMQSDQVSRVLVYRLGSIGDFVVSLPCLHLIRSVFPTQRIALLTNEPVVSKAAPAQSVLNGTGLIDEYMSYPIKTRNFSKLYGLFTSIKAFQPDVVIYLSSRKDRKVILRDVLFFKICGFPKVVGAPYSKSLISNRALGENFWESEACRLSRCMTVLGDARPDQLENWDLHLSNDEIATADRMVADFFSSNPKGRLLGVSLGTKQTVKDWGDDNWRELLNVLGPTGCGLLLVGAAEERERSAEVAKEWPGPVVNACGCLNPRQSAAIIKRASLFVCLDSGPMHLASSVGTPCVAIFSKINRPGEWYPFGNNNVVFYPHGHSSSIQDISAREVANTVLDKLNIVEMVDSVCDY